MCKTVQYLYIALSLSYKPCIRLWVEIYTLVLVSLKSPHMKPYSKYALFLIFTLFVQFLYSFTAPTLCAHIAPTRSHQLYKFCTTVICAHCACYTDLLCGAQKLRSRAHCAPFEGAGVTFRNMYSVTDSVICYRLLLPKSLRPNGKCLFLLMFSNLARLSQVSPHWTCTPAKAAPAAPVENLLSNNLNARTVWYLTFFVGSID